MRIYLVIIIVFGVFYFALDIRIQYYLKKKNYVKANMIIDRKLGKKISNKLFYKKAVIENLTYKYEASLKTLSKIEFKKTRYPLNQNLKKYLEVNLTTDKEIMEERIEILTNLNSILLGAKKGEEKLLKRIIKENILKHSLPVFLEKEIDRKILKFLECSKKDKKYSEFIEG